MLAVTYAANLRCGPGSRDLMYGMSRMYSMLTEERRPNRQVVRTMEEAYELLGVTSGQFVRVAAGTG